MPATIGANQLSGPGDSERRRRRQSLTCVNSWAGFVRYKLWLERGVPGHVQVGPARSRMERVAETGRRTVSFDGTVGPRSEGIHMKFKPLHDRVLIRRVEEEEKTGGGIIIPDTAKEKPMQGMVMAAGPGLRDETGRIQPLDVSKGDRVLFGKWSGTDIKIEEEELVIVKESDIMGIVE